MVVESKPAAEFDIDSSLVRALLREQHPDLADRPLVDVAEGWDNRLFRLGDDLVVRLPRRLVAAGLVEHEHRWLPHLSTRLPLPVPAPLRTGRPGCGFPWFWSITSWLPGETALLSPQLDIAHAAVALGQFLGALHEPAPADAPRNPWRAAPLASRTDKLKEHLQQLDGIVDRTQALALWESVLAAAPWSGPPLWIHGDLHPGNLLVRNGHLSAVIDWGDLTAGDPATDLSIIWMLLPPAARPSLLAAREAVYAVDRDTLLRARGWALAFGLVYMAQSRGDAAMSALGRATVNAALNDDGLP